VPLREEVVRLKNQQNQQRQQNNDGDMHSEPCDVYIKPCHDAFRNSFRVIDGNRKTLGLGNTGRQLYQMLSSRGPMTTKELAGFTGRTRPTVNKYLDKMRRLVNHKTGELIPMVELKPTAEGEKWHALPVDLNAVAVAVGTYGKGEAQRWKHTKERDEHSRKLES